MLPEYACCPPRFDYMTLEERRELQGERLKAQVRHVYENALFSRKKLNDAGVTPDDIKGLEDLTKIPFTTKQELQDDQEKNPPYGSYLAVHPSKLYQFFATSGTTGKPLNRTMSRRDWDLYIGRLAVYTPLNPGEIVVVLGPTDGLMGPSAGAAARMLMGAMVVRLGRYSTPEKISLIHQLKPTLVSSTGSFLLYLADKASEIGMAFSEMGSVRIVESVGEPAATIPATRERIKSAWGAKEVFDRYGSTEMCVLGRSCQGSTQLHAWDDYVIVEVMEIGGNRVLGPGERGEMVYTNIFGDSQPLLRYRSNDVGRLAEFGPCPGCGATCTRIVNGVEGRADDMIWYKGINIFPSAIENVVRSFPEVGNEYEIVLDEEGFTQTLTIRCEAKPEVLKEIYGKLSERIASKIQDAIEGVHAMIELLPEGTLPKTEGKAKRLRDNRNKTRGVA
jgi:phenylacetate-CoA ligase